MNLSMSEYAPAFALQYSIRQIHPLVSFDDSDKTYSELHGLGTGSTELSGNDNLATLGTALHDETENTVAGPTDGQTVEELVAEGLALSDGGQTAVLDLGGIEGDGVLGELEALLDEGCELADAATLLTENLLGVGGTDDYGKTRASVSNVLIFC
jgi:hypothetical protein